MVDEDERLARVGLACAAGLRDLPSLASAETLSPVQRWEQIAPLYPKIIPGRRVDDAARSGWRVLVPGDREWPLAPPGMPDVGEAPWALWVRGDGDLWKATRRSVAVLGARASTSYGDHVAAQIAGDLAARGWTVATTCALGCDRFTFAAATRSATAPIAVYAAESDLQAFDRCASARDGLLVSDAPPDTPQSRRRMLARQDLLTYLTAGVVLIETIMRSSTFATIYPAQRRGRLLMAVPGPITSSLSATCHYLIRNRYAVLVDSAEGISAVLQAAMTASSDGATR